jgi:hypothetical protein
MRKNWFEHVRKTRTKTAKKTKASCSHKEAMRLASITWEKEKNKILRKQKRDAKKNVKKQVHCVSEAEPLVTKSEPSQKN